MVKLDYKKNNNTQKRATNQIEIIKKKRKKRGMDYSDIPRCKTIDSQLFSVSYKSSAGFVGKPFTIMQINPIKPALSRCITLLWVL